MKAIKWTSFVLFGLFIGMYWACYARDTAPKPDMSALKLPAGFSIQIYSKLGGQYGQPRMMTFDAQGNLYVASPTSGQILMLHDSNGDGLAEPPIIIARQLNAPNSLTFVQDAMLVSNQDGIVKLTKTSNGWSAPQPFISGLADGGHTLKTVRLGPDGFLYLNVGSTCNVCNEQEATRATILRYTTEGKPAGHLITVGKHAPSAIWASGLRNSQGFAWHPVTGAFYATNEGADNRSDTARGRVNDEIPPEHLNIIVGGKHYGWPHCWGNPGNLTQMVEDPNFTAPSQFCTEATPPVATFVSHSTPIGITFLNKSQFPVEYQSDAIVALHGSWNRKQPSGYALVRVKFKDNQPIGVEDFVSGWLNGQNAWGRPVDVAVGTDGALYVSDDRTGYIYKISYQADKKK
ncbi:sorbosone dehydrogenase family protein [Methylotenera sp. 1P/1]|uniref:PQQ-dependent sugar dehydrogenase n=1 Tax=Methylotenera sp. 1P/1 TaxID=1131551 RepID=UPI0003784439|nr:PQQ-dependent sugar dehydrogenase [Methylotenera sp. 1P/1]